MSYLPLALAAVTLAGGAVAVLAAWRAAVAEEAMDVVLGGGDHTAPDDAFSQRLQEPLAVRLVKPLGRALASGASGLLPGNRIAEIRHTLALAGLNRAGDVDIYIASRMLGLGAGVVLGLLATTAVGGRSGLALGFVVLGLGVFAPKARVSRLRDQRVRAIRRDLADVLDLLAISVEAGAGLESAIETVVEHFDSPIGRELGQTLHEMELGTSRREALEHLKRRTEVPELNNFVVALIQADALGMPLGRVLRTQADAMRMRRRQIARETAAKLPVKMVFPLVLFILPALFIVILGPAAITIAQNLLNR